jgi:hypothetical protein
MSSNNYCDGCTCGRADAAQQTNGNGNGNEHDSAADPNSFAPENVQDGTAPRQQRSFTAPIGWEEQTEGVEKPSIPLRSKQWWNKPEDGEHT